MNLPRSIAAIVLALTLALAGRAGAAPKASDGANWGSTPEEVRPLLLRAERASRIPGAARFLAIVASRESGFNATAHNEEPAEVDASRRLYQRAAAERPALAYPASVEAFGSGGLFGMLAPLVAWAGWADLGDRAPFLGEEPTVVFDPRLAAFAAVAHMQQLLRRYPIKSMTDLRVAWAQPSLLGSRDAAQEAAYQAIRARFLADARELGISLSHPTMPQRPSAAAWPGAAAVLAEVRA